MPQGSPISPLLANLYMRRFVLGWKMLGLEQKLRTLAVASRFAIMVLGQRKAKLGDIVKTTDDEEDEAAADELLQGLTSGRKLAEAICEMIRAAELRVTVVLARTVPPEATL